MGSWSRFGAKHSCEINGYARLALRGDNTPSSSVRDPDVQAFPVALLPSADVSMADYVEHAADAHTQAQQPNPSFHPNENQRFFSSSRSILLAWVSSRFPSSMMVEKRM